MSAYNPRNHRMTVYDLMEANGYFAKNRANASAQAEDGSPLYEGPVEYPKMLYHPLGEEREVEPERVEPTPVGPHKVPAKMEMISKIVKNAEEESELRGEGWHDHPAKAISAAIEGGSTRYGKKAPAMSSDQRIKDLEAELLRVKGMQVVASESKTGSSKSAPLPAA